ncbi:TetR/AcrR family transcriptional regulator [Catenulispora subtropica]|uniref:TetR/AcrR family transcriptional regulator n=1 Tax=Catenulispora subtropica TaxID=450798 RepID=A0ABP5DDN0_9ACTN
MGKTKSAGAPAKEADVPRSIWERLETAPRSGRATLTHPQIAAAAVALADAEGLEALSMRKLAESLGVATMALYRYVDSKDELLELMIDAVVDPSVLTADLGDWRAVFREIATRHRETSLAHPWLVAAQAQVPNLLTPARNEVAERMIGALDPLPLTGDQKMQFIRAIDGFARGASGAEVNRRMMMERRGYGPDGDVRLLLRGSMQWLLRSGRYPRMAKLVRDGLAPVDSAAEFEIGVDAMLDGLAVRFGI